MGRFAEGIAVSDAAVREAEVIDDPFSLTTACGGAGVLSLRKGALDKAIPVLERGLDLCREVPIPLWFPWHAAALGAAYALAGRMGEALPLLARAVEQGASLRLLVSHARQLAYLGEVYVLAGRLPEALQVALRALELARTHQEQGHEAWVLRLLGDIAIHRDPPEITQVAAHYRQALALAAKLGMRPLQAHCHHGLGTMYAKTGQAEQARAALSAAIDLYRAMDMTFWLPQTEAALAQVRACDNTAAG